MNQGQSATDAIRNLKGRYFRIIDTKCFDELHDILTEDAYFDLEGIVQRDADGAVVVPVQLGELFPGHQHAVVRGRAEMVAFITGALNSVISIHHGFTPEIEVTGDSATAIWPMEDVFFGIAPPHGRIRHAYGHYADVYRREKGVWRIAGQSLSFLHQRWFQEEEG
ncbi:nuclear transport factor 2 family protein [Sphingobium sp. ZW T5_29]|uniref:nuclear transport factor 2 family protein n=1 Tax=Sphingobium sp. ZW T5_29 TaxID=3378077 RepID=UPI0038521A89